MQRNGFLILSLCVFILGPLEVFAQETGKIEGTERQLKKEELLQKKIEEKKEAPVIEEQKPAVPTPPAGVEKVLVKKIRVTGVTLFTEKEIASLIAPFENKELTLTDMQKVADLITDEYRKKGYVTSRAYLPPQKIEEGVLEIRVIEGVTGNIEVKGNRFFRAALIRKGIKLKKGEPFDYDTLRWNLSKLNEHPDRNVKAVLVPGKEPGTTDIVLEVKDTLPVHLGLGWDNYGSRFLRKNRESGTLYDNNLFGIDDMLTLNYQAGDAQDYELLSARYLVPVAEKVKLGFFGSSSKLALGKELRDVMARGKSKTYSLYATYDALTTQNTILTLNTGFDYLDVFNFQLGSEQSRDRLRIAKAGFDLDVSDPLGRTILSPLTEFGIADVMGGLREKDDRSSRAGAGGEFVKSTINLLRLQKMPFSSVLLWRNQFQIAPNIMTAAEQFQLGGIANVRGYPNAEFVGDQGYSMTWEWSVPPYFFPKDLLVPFSKARFYDAFRIVVFYDWANAQLHNPQPGEEKSKTLRGLGCGIRFNLPENFSIRADFAWPLDNTPSDSDHFHPWLQVAKEF